MASGAHITSANLTQTPTVFEVVAQEKLSNLIQPALARLIRLVVNRYPVIATYASPETIVRSAYAVLQAHFLFLHKGTAGEHFYGLERVNSRGHLTFKDKLRSLAIICLLPYFKDRLQTLSERRDQTANSKLIAYVQKLYPYAVIGVQTWDFLLSMRFLMRKTGHHSLEQLISGTVLRRSGPVQEEKIGLARALGSVLTYSVTVGVFFIQFLQWWQDHGKGSVRDTTVPVPPVHLRDRSGPCRLCGNDVVNPAALSTSGYVFCYPCIYGYVRREGKCPVTGYPSAVDCLVRLHTSGM